MYDDVLEEICSICGTASGITPRIGYLPTNGGVACYPNSGYNVHLSFQKETLVDAVTVLFNVKMTSQETALQTAETMYYALITATSYESTKDYTIMNIESSSVPTYVGREDEYFLYAFAVTVFMNRKG